MTAFILLGIITMIIGILFLVNPSILIKFSELMNRIVTTDNKAIKYRISMGLVMLALSLFFLFMAYYLNQLSG